METKKYQTLHVMVTWMAWVKKGQQSICYCLCAFNRALLYFYVVFVVMGRVNAHHSNLRFIVNI